MSKRWRIAGSVVLLAFLAWRIDYAQFGQAFAGLDLGYWFLAAGVYFMAQLVSSLRWQLLSQPLGFQAPWRHYLAFYYIGMFFNLLLPTSVGGDVVRAFYLAGGRARRDAVLSVLADRGSGLVVLLLMACFAGLFVPLPSWMAAILVALITGVALGVASLFALPLLDRIPIVGPRLRRLIESARIYLSRPGLLFSTTLLSILVQFASVLQVWLISEGLGLNVSLGYLAVVVPLVTLLTLVPVSVSGMGLRELGMVVLLAPVGVASAGAVTLSLLTFASCAVIGLAGGGLYLFGRFSHVYPDSSVDSGDTPTSVEGRFDAEPERGSANQRRTGQSPAAA